MDIMKGFKWLLIIWLTGVLFPFSVIFWIFYMGSKYGKGIGNKFDENFGKK